MEGACECDLPFSGRFCQIEPACDGVIMADGLCCVTGSRLDVEGRCCISGAIDSLGACCASGVVDVCGECDGTAIGVDVQGRCYSEGILDESGVVCTSAMLDECGVCDGPSSSCRTTVRLALQSDTRRALMTARAERRNDAPVFEPPAPAPAITEEFKTAVAT